MELFVGFSAIPSSEAALSSYWIFIVQIHFASSRGKEIEEIIPNVTPYASISLWLAGTFWKAQW